MLPGVGEAGGTEARAREEEAGVGEASGGGGLGTWGGWNQGDFRPVWGGGPLHSAHLS